MNSIYKDNTAKVFNDSRFLIFYDKIEGRYFLTPTGNSDIILKSGNKKECYDCMEVLKNEF